MNKLYSTLLLLILLSQGFSSSAQTQIQMPMPAQTSTFTGNVRGYYFVAPSCFTITGAMIPTDASTGDQSIAIVRFNNTPPIYSTTTNDFTLLYLTQNNTNSGILPVNIQVEQGDIIGVLGQRSNVGSYSSSGNTTTINGVSVPLSRLGMQFPLTTTSPQQLWTESAANISRVHLYYDTLLTYNFTANAVTSTDYTFNNGADTSFVNAWDYGDGSPLDTTITPAHTYATSGNYTVCSYITTTCGTDTICGNITVCIPTTTSQNIDICNGETYTIGSSTYSNSGNYEDTLVSVFGCDSIVNTALNVLPSSLLIQDISFCQGDSLVVGMNSYYSSGTYNDTLTAANGCDSTVISNLTVLTPTNFTQTPSICQGESFDYNGNSYTTTGIYYDTLVNAAGCDSIVTTDLTVFTITSETQDVELCFGETYTINNNTYSSSGTYTDTLQSVNGCDSIIVTNLTIGNQIPTTVQVNGITLTAPAGYSYQWIDCQTNTAVPGATSQSFTPTQNGQYAVKVSDGTCSETSSCTTISTIGIEENWLQQLSVYPNPVKDKLTIQLNDHEAEIFVRDANGTTVYEAKHSGTAEVNMATMARGVYFLVIRTQSGNELVKEIVKQ